MEDALKEAGVPPAELDCSLSTYVDIACGSLAFKTSKYLFEFSSIGLLDIPVYEENRIQSLHLLLSLYSELGRLQKQ